MRHNITEIIPTKFLVQTSYIEPPVGPLLVITRNAFTVSKVLESMNDQQIESCVYLNPIHQSVTFGLNLLSKSTQNNAIIAKSLVYATREIVDPSNIGIFDERYDEFFEKTLNVLCALNSPTMYMMLDIMRSEDLRNKIITHPNYDELALYWNRTRSPYEPQIDSMCSSASEKLTKQMDFLKTNFTYCVAESKLIWKAELSENKIIICDLSDLYARDASCGYFMSQMIFLKTLLTLNDINSNIYTYYIDLDKNESELSNHDKIDKIKERSSLLYGIPISNIKSELKKSVANYKVLGLHEEVTDYTDPLPENKTDKSNVDSIKCNYCIQCSDCTNCTMCENCTKCSESSYCESCSNGINLFGCIDLKNASNMVFCTENVLLNGENGYYAWNKVIDKAKWDKVVNLCKYLNNYIVKEKYENLEKDEVIAKRTRKLTPWNKVPKFYWVEISQSFSEFDTQITQEITGLDFDFLPEYIKSQNELQVALKSRQNELDKKPPGKIDGQRVLLLSNDIAFIEEFKTVYQSKGLVVDYARSESECINKAKTGNYSVCVLDAWWSKYDFENLVQSVLRSTPLESIQFLLLNYGEDAQSKKLRDLGVNFVSNRRDINKFNSKGLYKALNIMPPLQW
ncbi:MAG: hypothetical protein M3P33_02950 [bacterium]|nr:hypothetical protein [bacterium]